MMFYRRPLYYRLNPDRSVSPVDTVEEAWASKWSQGYVGNTHIGGDVHVSTVFLVFDHGFGSEPPLVFETMVFGGPLDQEQDRYSTWEQAEAGHREMVKRVRAGSLEGRSRVWHAIMGALGRG